MYEIIALIELSLWFGLPAWIANATPVLLGGGPPIDGGRVLRDGHRILGDGKTIRGFVVGVIFGTLAGTAQSFVAPLIPDVLSEFVLITSDMETVLFMTIPIAVLMSIGALTGDLIGSFLKRRIDIKSGNPSPVMDQLGFIILALLFASPIIQPAPIYVMILVSFTLAIHWISNALGYLLGLKKHPW
ncbi:MAG: CDP-2,3-bis-(O-geranylgeranyl)-sn-glycerol synthase [Candidatus Lokiarchaeota archaeon]|nr:CDP-2,3-bis-(O-geranylgeranyl)-sn-glycerol synthase [Candidatus Lokiarchaeota archaeon]